MSSIISKLTEDPLLLMGLHQVGESETLGEAKYPDAVIVSALPEIASLLKTYNNTVEAFKRLDEFMMVEFSEESFKNSTKVNLAKALTRELDNLMNEMSQIRAKAKSVASGGNI